MRVWWLCALLPGLAMAAPALPVYPGASHVRIGDELWLAGQRLQIACFTTAEPLQQVARYFFQEWTEQGLPAVVDGDLVHEGTVSAFLTREGVQQAVMLVSQGGKTLGFTVLKDLWARSPAQPRETLLPEGTIVSDSTGTRQQAAVVEMGLPSVQAELEARLARDGFQRARPIDQGRRHVLLEHARDDQTVSTALTEIEPGVVAILQTHGRATP